MSRIAFIVLVSATLAACGTPTTGIVPIGDGLYMSSKSVGMLTYTGGEVKAELYREATGFCAKQGKGVIPVSSSSQNSRLAAYASAEIQFGCGTTTPS